MQVLIVHAHPEPRSFCGALRDVAVETLGALGHEVAVSDLYAMGFDPVGGSHDFTARVDPAYFKYQAEQVHAAETRTFAPEVAGEIAKLMRADLVLFTFPLWWFGLPAILKGWVDRVFAMGVAYGGGKVYETGVFRGRRAMCALTTGGPAPSYEPAGRNGEIHALLFPVHHGVFYFCGMSVLPPFVVFGPVRQTPEQRAAELERWRERLRSLDAVAPMDLARVPGF